MCSAHRFCLYPDSMHEISENLELTTQEVRRVERESLERVRYNSRPMRADADEAVAVVMHGIGEGESGLNRR